MHDTKSFIVCVINPWYISLYAIKLLRRGRVSFVFLFHRILTFRFHIICCFYIKHFVTPQDIFIQNIKYFLIDNNCVFWYSKNYVLIFIVEEIFVSFSTISNGLWNMYEPICRYFLRHKRHVSMKVNTQFMIWTETSINALSYA